MITNVDGYILHDIFKSETSEKEWDIFAKDISTLLSNYCKENNAKDSVYKAANV